MSIKQTKAKFDFFEVKRISIYLYEAQLNKIDEICQRREKTRRRIFLEAVQNYIALYEGGKI